MVRIYTAKDYAPKKWNNPEYEILYNNAVGQSQQLKSEATYRNTKGGMALQTFLGLPRSAGTVGKVVGQAVGSGVTRAGISGYEALGDLSTGMRAGVGSSIAAARSGGSLRDRQKAGMESYYKGLERLKSFDERKYYNTPFGELGSVQKESQARAEKIMSGEDKLYTALNPMIDTILDVSDVTLVGALPKLAKNFTKYVAKRGTKTLTKNIGEITKAVDEGKDVSVFVKNKQAKDYIAQNKKMTADEKKNILLKDAIVDDIETGLRTPLSSPNQKFVAGVVDDAIEKNGFEATVKNLTEIQQGIVKQLDESTTQTRMVREALEEGLEKSDEVAQQKAIVSHQVHKQVIDEDLAGKSVVKKAAVKRQTQEVKKAMRERDAKKTIAEYKKLKELKKTKVKKAKKKTIKQTIRPEKIIKTTERRLLKKKLQEQSKNMSAGKRLGKAEQKTLFNTITKYAKASGLPEKEVGKLLTQKRIANVSSKKQLDKIIKSIDTKTGQSILKVAKQSVLDVANKKIDAIKPLKKSYEKETGTQKVLNTLKSTAKKAKDPELKKQATQQYEAAAKKADEAQAHATQMYKTIHRVSASIGDTNAKELAKRLGIPKRNQAFSAYLYGGETFSKQMKKFEKAAKLFKEGDKLIPAKPAWALQQMGIEGAEILPQRLLKKRHELADLLNSGTFKSIAPMFNSPQRMKRKSEFIAGALTKAQEAEAVSESRIARHNIFFKELKKLFKTVPKKDRKGSEAVIQGLVEDAPISGNKIETQIADSFKKLLDDNAKYLEKTDGNFVRREGYFPKNDLYDDDLIKSITKHGIEDGLKAFFKQHTKATSADAMRAMHNGMKGDSANFLKARKGDKEQAKDVFESMMRYQSEFERLKLIREADPYIAAMKIVGEEVATEARWLGQYASLMEKGLKATSDTKFMDKATSLMYVAKLGVSTPSAAANLVGGLSMDFLTNGAINTIKGAARWGKNPVEMHRLFSNNGMMSGNFIEYGTSSITSNVLKKGADVAMLQQKAAEHTIRIKQMSGLLSDKSYAAFKKQGANFKIPKDEMTSILDNIERTQGHFSKLHTAPIFKTWYGKAALPFTRWMFNSADIMTQSAKDIATFPKHGDVAKTRKALGTFTRAAVLVYGGMQLKDYATKDFAETGKINKIVKRAGEAMMETATGGALIPTSMAEMPLFEDAKKAANTYSLTKAKMGLGEYPFDYEELDTAGDIYFFGTTFNKMFDREKESVLSMYSEYSSLNDSEKAIFKRDVLAENKLAGRDVSGTFQRYERYSKYNINREEFDLSFISDKKDKAKRVKKYISSLPKEKQAETLDRLLKAKIVKKEDLQ